MTDYLSGYDNGWRDALKDKKERAKAAMSPEHQAVVDENLALRNEIDRLNAIIHSPESNDFIKGVSIEAEFQRQTRDDTGKAAVDWHRLLGYLAGKALSSFIDGDMEKGKHHITTTAAACLNWHRATALDTST